MVTSFTVRLTPGQFAGLDALVREEGGTVSGHIRTGVQMRLDLGMHRQALQKIAREELNAAFELQRAEWEALRAEMLQTAQDTDSNMRGLMASFLQKISEATSDAFSNPAHASVPAPVSTGSADAMPRRSR